MTKSKFLTKVSLSLITLFIIMSCERELEPVSFIDESYIAISKFIENNDEFSMFWEVLVYGNLDITLSAYNPFGNDGYTVFVPTNAAFERFINHSPEYNSFEDLLADEFFVSLLGRYHIVNKEINTNDFPYGALPDTTASGDLLTIGFSSDLDTSFYKINNVAPVIVPNLELSNGTIHVINEVLEPVAYSSFDWLKKNGDNNIIVQALELTKLNDTLGVYRNSSTGNLVNNYYTLLVEPDSLFFSKGIFTIDDLINRYSTPGLDYDDPENIFYQFVAYHILEGSYFLDEFDGSRNYNTYAFIPISISQALDIRINYGEDTITLEINDGDTTAITYRRLDYYASNILSKNGAIHRLRDILELKTPSRSTRTFQFYEENDINALKKIRAVHPFVDSDAFEYFHWTGPEEILYVKAHDTDKANNDDYIEIKGNFTIEYTIPKVLPGRWEMIIQADANSNQNANIWVYVDGKKLGSSFDLTKGGDPYKKFLIGTVEFLNYSEHTITVSSLIPGTLKWDYLRFEPVQ